MCNYRFSVSKLCLNTNWLFVWGSCNMNAYVTQNAYNHHTFSFVSLLLGIHYHLSHFPQPTWWISIRAPVRLCTETHCGIHVYKHVLVIRWENPVCALALYASVFHFAFRNFTPLRYYLPSRGATQCDALRWVFEKSNLLLIALCASNINYFSLFVRISAYLLSNLQGAYGAAGATEHIQCSLKVYNYTLCFRGETNLLALCAISISSCYWKRAVGFFCPFTFSASMHLYKLHINFSNDLFLLLE